jgi:hypothetical protein
MLAKQMEIKALFKQLLGINLLQVHNKIKKE